MYDDLIAALRGPYDSRTDIQLMKQAADAIEELSLTAESYRRSMEAWADEAANAQPRWIPVTERLPSDFVSVQAHMTDAGNFPPVREAYVVDKLWFFPALKEFHPVDMWRQFDEPPKEE